MKSHNQDVPERSEYIRRQKKASKSIIKHKSKGQQMVLGINKQKLCEFHHVLTQALTDLKPKSKTQIRLDVKT